MWKHRLFSSDWFFDLSIYYDYIRVERDKYYSFRNKNYTLDVESTFKPRFDIVSPLEFNIGKFITDKFMFSIGLNLYVVSLDTLDTTNYYYDNGVRDYTENIGNQSDEDTQFNIGYNLSLDYSFNKKFALRAQYKYVKYDDFDIYSFEEIKNHIYSAQLIINL